MTKGGWIVTGSALIGLLIFILNVSGGAVIPQEAVDVIKEQATTQIQNSFGTKTDQPVASSLQGSSSVEIPEEGVPLHELALGEAQKKILETAGVDTQAFVISKEMFLCAEAEVGGERVAAFVAGETPTLLEIRKLLPCLKG